MDAIADVIRNQYHQGRGMHAHCDPYNRIPDGLRRDSYGHQEAHLHGYLQRRGARQCWIGRSGGAPERQGDGETVTVRKLMGYIEEQLTEITKKYKQEAQYPVVDSRGMDFPLVVAK